MVLRVAHRVAAGSQDEDRVAVVPVLGGHVLVLADGAGGRSGGRAAAEGVIRLALDQARALASDSLEPVELLRAIDAALAGDPVAGEATAVVAVVTPSQVHGASVGDSGAWLVSGDPVTDLTRRQVRKPMIGSGAAVPIAFGPVALAGRLLLASDGLLKYSPRDRLLAAANEPRLSEAVNALIETVRLRSGALPDDVAVILCERSA